MIIFQNDGIVPIAAFTTFGMSAKPGSTNPIGKFGTGLKNSVAIILRLGGKVRLFRGREEYEFYTKEEDFRGQTFARVRMKRRKGVLSRWTYEEMPFTTELGKHWLPWMAVRELEANCRDERNPKSFKAHDTYADIYLQDHIDDDRTVIVVECPEFEAAYDALDEIFLPPTKTLLYEDGTCCIYEGESKYLFYRGMRVTDLRKPSLFTYEMKTLTLTEDRTSMYSYYDSTQIKRSLLACNVEAIIDKVVQKSADSYEGSFDWDEKKPTVSHVWRASLGYSGISPRFVTLRENLNYGISGTEDVSIELPAASWARVIEVLENVGDAASPLIREQLVEAGWKFDVEKLVEDADEEEPAVETEPFKQAASDDVPF